MTGLSAWRDEFRRKLKKEEQRLEEFRRKLKKVEQCQDRTEQELKRAIKRQDRTDEDVFTLTAGRAVLLAAEEILIFVGDQPRLVGF